MQLVLALRAKPNVLLLDEPTNDLDLDTLRVLEDVLDGWPGAVVVVSHDRAFLERTVTDVLVLDERHPGRRVPGGYAAWEAERRSRRTAGRAVATSAARAPAGPPSRRASFRSRDAGRGPDRPTAPPRRSPSTLRRLQREAEREVEALERRRAKLVGELEAAGDDHEALARAGTALAAVEAELGEAEHRWLELAGELDELDA